MLLTPLSLASARRPIEQLSPTEDGYGIFDSLGLCRFEIRAGSQPLGALLLTSPSPSSPYVGQRDYWCWSASPWPQGFELHHTPGLSLPGGQPEIHPQLVFSSTSGQHDLSASGTTVWRVRQGELVQGAPAMTDLGFLVRKANGSLAWYADAAPSEGIFQVPSAGWLEMVQISNTGLVIEAVPAIPGAIG